MIPRHAAITTIMGRLRPSDLVVSTTGMISREVFRERDRAENFYMLGSMGLASAFGLGLALDTPQRRVLVLEGDGSALMSLGTLPLIAAQRPANLVHVILDNEAYESTGAQASISAAFDLAALGRSAGYRRTTHVTEVPALETTIDGWDVDGPHLALIKVSIAPVKDIPRVSWSPEEIRDRFAACVHQERV